MDDVAGDERKRLETIQSELADVRGRLDRLYDLVETTTEFNMADFAHRIRDHKERLESAAEGARAILAQRRAVLDDVKTITAYAKDMSRFLQKSELTERRAFIETFVKEIVVMPGDALLRYTVPMPDDSLIPGRSAEKVALNGSVLPTLPDGGPKHAVLRTRTKGRNGLCQKPCAAFLGQLPRLHMRQPVTPITMGMRVSMTAQNCPSASLLGDRELNQFQKNRMNTATAP